MSRRLALPFFAVLLAAAPLAAQPADPAPAPLPPPLTLSYADGRVDVVRPDGVEAARVPDLLEDDDRLVVADGRAELVFDDGTLVHVDRDTDLRIDPDVRLRLVHGRIVVHTTRDAPLVVATPAGLATLDPRGTYDLTAGDLDADTTVAVIAGHASMRAGADDVVVPMGDELRLDPRDRRARWARVGYEDAFRVWSRSRAGQTTMSAAASFLPPAVQPWASDFSVYGLWSSLPAYGAVWFPRVGPEWRPYAAGSWRYTRYGWTWIDSVRWGWPVHHYGRWGRHASRGWYWIPQRRWGPGWVSWAVAADHVAWSPLGWDARPVVDFFAGVRVGPVGLWANSWSIVPRHRFGGRRFGWADYQDPRRLPGPVLGGFVSQMIGPRGPAGADDRFAVRRPRAARIDAAVPRGLPPPVMYSPGGTGDTRDGRVVDPRPERGDDVVRRRPMDAPSGGAGAIAAPPGRPRDRVGATTTPDPAPPATDGPRGEVRPVGPPVRPRAGRPADPPSPAYLPPGGRVGSGRSDGRERGNGPAAVPRGGSGPRPAAPPPSGSGDSSGDGSGAAGNRRRPAGAGAGAPAGRGDGAGPGANRGPGGARRPG